MLLPFSPDVKVQQAQREQMAVMSFLAGLPAEFETAKSHILSGSTISSLQDTYSRILRTENPQSAQSGSALVSRRYEYDAGRQPYRSGGRGVDTRGQSSEAIVCHYCHKPGHMKRDCRKLQSRNQGFRSAQVASSSDASGKSITVSADDFAKFSQYQESLRSSSTPVTAIAESGKPNTCLLSSSSKWVIDSGATDHMTGNSSLLSTFQSYTSRCPVTLANGVNISCPWDWHSKSNSINSFALSVKLA